MRILKSQYQLGILIAAWALLAVTLACAAPEPSATPVAPAPPAPPVAPTPLGIFAPVATATTAPTPAGVAATPTPFRSLPTPTPTTAVVTQARHGPVPGAQYGGVIRWGGAVDIRVIDGANLTTFSERYVTFLVYNLLVKYESDFSIQPELAKSWQISSDGKAVTFKLQEGVKFTDGTDFNAGVVKWSFDRMLDPKEGARQRVNWSPYIDSVQVVDNYTVTFNLKTAFRAFLSQFGDTFFGGTIVSPTAVAKYGKDYGRNPVGTGPYKLKEWVYGDRLIFEPNKDYWEKGPPYLDQIRALNVPEETVQIAMLRTGELDIQDTISPRYVDILKANPRLKVVEYPTCRAVGLMIAGGRPPWDNKALRQALAYSQNRKAIIDILTEGRARPAYSPEGDCYWWSDPTLKMYEFSLAKAKEKLAEAGYPKGITVPFWATSTAASIQEAEFYKAMLEEAGIRLDIIAMETSALRTATLQGKIDLATTFWTPRADPHLRLFSVYHSGGVVYVRTGWKSADVDSLMNKASGIYDQAEAKKLYDQIQRIVVEEVGSYYFTYFPFEYTAMDRRVQNYVDIPDRIVRFRYLWIKQ